MRIALAQANPTVGDISGNQALIRRYLDQAKDGDVDIVAFPEMVINGYPPQDLLYEKGFISDAKAAVEELADDTEGLVVVIGFVDYDSDWNLYNAAMVFDDGKIIGTTYKTLLPTYDVFDEERYFRPLLATDIAPFSVRVGGAEVDLGVEICEDLWDDAYSTKVTKLLCQRGADVVINISASPFHVGKRFDRMGLVSDKAKKLEIPIFLVNLVGGQDELVFDGQSVAADKSGKMIAFGNPFQEEMITVDIDLDKGTAEIAEIPEYDKDEEIFNALVLGIRDYFKKTGFKRGIIGLSGGIDSSVSACIASEALGADNVIGVYMPSQYSSEHSREDAEKLAKNLEMLFLQFSIQDIMQAYQEALDNPLKEVRDHYSIDASQDDPLADENIQPRIRANCMMDFSNRLRDLRILLLNTGNKTELALGYSTLYGDLTGGISILGDVSKLQVYSLARYINRKHGTEVIPEGSITKLPSAELKPNQYDPFNFDIVSPMVDEIVENRKGKKELIDMGFPEEVVEDVYSRFRNAEYKRWQAPPAIKITKKAFGMGWKMPIVNKYRE
jgi:NAD+ synthase (glutamine-hydrolysing)